MLFGQSVEVTISDLVNGGTSYEGRAIRTKGNLEMDIAQGSRQYLLSDVMGNKIYLLPVREMSANWDDDALKMTGKEVQVRQKLLPPDIPEFVMTIFVPEMGHSLALIE